MTNSENSRGRLGTRPAARVRRERRRHRRPTGARQKRPPGYRPSFTPPARSPGTGRSRRARSSSEARRRPTAAAPLKSVGAPIHSHATVRDSSAALRRRGLAQLLERPPPQARRPARVPRAASPPPPQTRPVRSAAGPTQRLASMPRSMTAARRARQAKSR